MRCRLNVHLDDVAVLRQAGTGSDPDPDPVEAAALAERAGADGVTIHLREARREVQDRDVEILRRTVKTHFTLEMAPSQDMVAVALEVRPDSVTLVAEHREEIGVEGGLDVVQNRDMVQRCVRILQDGGVEVGIFVEPDLDQVRAAHKLDARRVVLHAGRYGEGRSFQERSEELARLRNGAKAARKVGMEVVAARGLNFHNVVPVARIPDVSEVGIGHGLIAQALFEGLPAAVGRMTELLREARIDLLRS